MAGRKGGKGMIDIDIMLKIGEQEFRIQILTAKRIYEKLKLLFEPEKEVSVPIPLYYPLQEGGPSHISPGQYPNTTTPLPPSET